MRPPKALALQSLLCFMYIIYAANHRYTKLNSYISRQISLGIKTYPDRPRRVEAFDWGVDEVKEEDHSKTEALISELIRKKIGVVEQVGEGGEYGGKQGVNVGLGAPAIMQA